MPTDIEIIGSGSGGGGGGTIDDITSSSLTITNSTGPTTNIEGDPVGAAATAQSNAESFATSAVATETSRAEAAEALLAPLASPHLTGVPTSPTASPGTSTTQLATTAFVEGAIPTTLPSDSLPSQIGTLVSIGHSWLIGGGGGVLSGTALPPEIMGRQTLLGRLTSMFGIHEDNLVNLAIGGSCLTQPVSPVLGASFSGWSGVNAFALPENTATVYGQTGFTNYQIGATAGPPALIVHGIINDAGLDFTSWPTQGLTAWSAALTSVIAKLRCSNLYGSTSPQGTVTWDSSIAFGGGGAWTSATGTALMAVTGYGSPTGAAVNTNPTTGGTVTITLPTNVPPVFTVDVFFQGNPTGYTTVGGGGITNVATTLPVTAATEFPAAGINFVVKIDSEEMLVTAGQGTTSWTVTRAVNGTSAAAHSAGAVIITAPDTTSIAFSGTVANSTGTIQLSGQGYGGSGVEIVKRIACTAADAGKTIICTSTIGTGVSGINPRVTFDCWGIEATTPPPVVIANAPRATSAEAGNPSFATAVALNAATSTVVAGFDSAVQIADFDTPVYNRSAQLNGAINNSVTTINITTNGTNLFPTAGANRISIYAPGDANLEDIFIPAGGVSGSAPNLTLTGVTRGYNGTSATSHLTGADITDRSYWATDNVHPIAFLHSIFATQAYAAFQAAVVNQAPTQPYQLAVSGGNFQEHRSDPSLALVDNFYLTPSTGVWNTVTATIGTIWLSPIYIAQRCYITEMGFNLATVGATSVVRCGIYLPITDGRPFQLLQDFGTVATSSGTGSKLITGLYQQLRPGWYFMGVAAQVGTAPQISFAPSSPTVMSAAAPTAVGFGGFTTTGVAGAFPATLTGLAATEAVVAYLRLRSKPWQ